MIKSDRAKLLADAIEAGDVFLANEVEVHDLIAKREWPDREPTKDDIADLGLTT